jgi:phenazine biosynthesis protein phzE
MFAPTVTGSPIENAARVIARYESGGRGYYSGVLALIGHDDAERQTLDAPILIRTCEISASGSIRASVGATLVRGSSPQHEVAETHAKLGGLLSALGAVTRAVQPRSDDRPVCSVEVADALRRRNTKLARFWVDPQPQDGVSPPDDLAGTHALIVNFEDEWTAMLAHQLRHLGMKVDTRRWDRLDSSDDIDLVVAGPGPGDPRDDTDPRIAAAGSLLTERIGAGRPTVAICLSHQVLARQLGFPIRRLPEPHQGTQDRIDLFGTRTDVGFYNTFSAFADANVPGVSVSADRSGAVHALVGPGFASSQFHPESLLTSRGIDILRAMARAASATTPMTTLAF